MTANLGSLASLRRYPVKSMMGESLNAARITQRGLFGDRSYALCDTATGMVVSAKNPQKWSNLFTYHAAYTSPPAAGEGVPPVRVTLPDGGFAISSSSDFAADSFREIRAISIAADDTAAQYNEVRVGAYASVVQAGTIRIGDTITVA